MDTIIFIIVAYIGGTLGIKLKLPAGALLGSMFLVGLLQMTNLIEFTDVSPYLRIASKIALGTMIGLMFTKDILKLPVKQLLSFLVVGLTSIASALFLGFIFQFFGVFPFVTGMVSTAPGGIAEMLTLADAIKIDTQEVVMMHLIRFVTLMLMLKWLLSLNQKRGSISS